MLPNYKLSIVHITNNYIPYCGGVVSSITTLVTELQRSKHQVSIITLDFLGKDHNDPDYVFRIQCPLKFSYKQNYMAVPLRATKQITALLQNLKPDIIHIHHPFLLGVAGLKAARKLKIPVIFTYHTMYEQYAHYIPLPRKLVEKIVQKRVLWFCNEVKGIVAPSNFIKNYLQKNSVKAPIEVIPSALNSIFLGRQSVRTECLTKFQEPRGVYKRVKLLVVSRFRKEKNLPFVLDVFKQLPNYKFKLILAGYGSELENLQQYAFTNLELSENDVQFIIKPQKEELILLYRQADLFLFPSQTDTQGLVLAEAMAFGTPVIALPGPGQNDIIKQGKNGFIVTSKKQMVETIKMIMQEQSFFSDMKKSAFETSKKYYSEIIGNRIRNFYRFFNDLS